MADYGMLFDQLVSLEKAIPAFGVDDSYYIFYRTINTVNGKVYFGVHKTKDLKDGYLGSGKYLRNAIDKYGCDKFVRDELVYLENRNQMLKFEKQVLSRDFVQWVMDNSLGYNLKGGGDGGWYIGTKSIIGIRARNGTHQSQLGSYTNPFLTRPDGTSVTLERVNSDGYVNPNVVRVSCIYCRLETCPSSLSRDHGSRCESAPMEIKVKKPSFLKTTCQYCGTTVANNIYSKDHGSKCNLAPDDIRVNKIPIRRTICCYCGKDVPNNVYSRSHGDKCRMAPTN